MALKRLWRNCRGRDGVPSLYAIQSLDGEAIVCKVVIFDVPRFELRMRQADGKFSPIPTAVFEHSEDAKAVADNLVAPPLPPPPKSRYKLPEKQE